MQVVRSLGGRIGLRWEWLQRTRCLPILRPARAIEALPAAECANTAGGSCPVLWPARSIHGEVMNCAPADFARSERSWEKQSIREPGVPAPVPRRIAKPTPRQEDRVVFRRTSWHRDRDTRRVTSRLRLRETNLMSKRSPVPARLT